MNFIDFTAFFKQLKQDLTMIFFPSKTDLISIADEKGEPTVETLAERLNTLEQRIKALENK